MVSCWWCRGGVVVVVVVVVVAFVCFCSACFPSVVFPFAVKLFLFFFMSMSFRRKEERTLFLPVVVDLPFFLSFVLRAVPFIFFPVKSSCKLAT